jgi:hypothetical protein
MSWEKNRLIVGAVALVALVGLAVWVTRSETGETSAAKQEDDAPALPEIDKDEVDGLEVRRPEGETIKVVKKDDGSWTLTEPVEAVPDESAITTALDKLAGLEVTGVAATKEANHERLEVDAKSGIHVIPMRDGEPITHLIFGAYKGGNTMVRVEGETPVLSVKGSLKYAFNKELKSWRERKIVDVDAKKVSEARFESGESAFHFVRGDDDEWKLAEDMEEIERFKASKVQSLVSSLARMRAVDFAGPEMTPEKAGLDEATATTTLVVTEGGDEETTDGGAEAVEGTTAASEERIVLRLGAATEDDDGKFYLRRDDSDVIFIVSKYLADRVAPDVEKFQEAEEGEEAASAAAPTKMPTKAPTKLPPGLMQKLKAQAQAQQR